MQAEGFPDLQSFRAAFLLHPQPAGRPPGESLTHFGPARPVHPAEDLEPVGGWLLEVVQVGIQPRFTPAAVEVDIAHDTALVEQVEQFGKRLVVPASAEVLPQVVMGVTGREARLHDRGGFAYQFGLRGKILEFHKIF